MEDFDYSPILWFTAGVALGATVALLFAPASGPVTRRRIVRKAEEGRDVLVEAGRDVLDRSRDLYDKGRKLADEAADMFERGKKLVEG